MRALEPAVFATVFVALYAAHQVGDHWVQTHHQAITKGKPGRSGQRACGNHVIALTGVKVLAVLLVALVAGISFPLWHGTFVVLAFTADALSHYWADRRTTLLGFADRISRLIPGKGDFARLGDGMAAPTGTGAYALDQSFHIGVLFLTALLASIGATS